MTDQECHAAQHRIQQAERVYVHHPEFGCCLVRLIDASCKGRGWVSFIFGRSGGWQCYADEIELMEPTEEQKLTIAH